jgi:hypothetical protein
VQVNTFGQYQDSNPAPAFVKWLQNTRRHLKPNDTIEEGEIIQTTGTGFVKILFKDDSLMDIGPEGLIQVQKFKLQNNERSVFIKLLYGKIASIVAKPLSGPQSYQVATPSALMGVRGTEFLVHVHGSSSDLESQTRPRTDVVCLHGQVSVDVAKHTDKGLVYYQPVVVNPGAVFSSEGFHGLGQTTTVRMLPQSEMRTLVAQTSPQVNVHGTVVSSAPPPSHLPGTGVAMPQPGQRAIALRSKPINVVSSFDMDHPPISRSLASPSGNFEIPRNFGSDAAAFGSTKDFRSFTGPAPISLLPGNTSRVRVNLLGL